MLLSKLWAGFHTGCFLWGGGECSVQQCTGYGYVDMNNILDTFKEKIVRFNYNTLAYC